jgi:hypothetical protein
MILNKAAPQVEAKLRIELPESPVARAVFEAIDQTAEHFEVVADATGFEARAAELLPTGLPNRARLKIFSPRPGHTLVFFYKKSLVPYSRDRYSYGGIDLRDGTANPQEIVEWITFVSSGFHPDKRPPNMRRAFPYEIPE